MPSSQIKIDPIKAGLFQSGDDIAVNHLLDSIMAKNNELDSVLIKKALEFTIKAHSDQFRKSGMPYAEHPYEVSKLLAEYKLDTETVISGLLHDVVEDTKLTVQDIRNEFGENISFMVDAVTKITQIQEGEGSLESVDIKEKLKIETYRKLLISMAKDPRILMIKITDRLHNMRTLHYIPNDLKRKRISQETLDVYAPLSHRFGLSKIKGELEDLCFKQLHPDIYRIILSQLAETKEAREAFIFQTLSRLKDELSKAQILASVQGRPKNLYSIYHKVKDKKLELDNIYDIFALRIITQTHDDCYRALGIVHKLWAPLQSRFKDYIASPKPNLYQSLHTTVVCTDEKLVEVQIRTKEMNEISEKGFASHWSYKNSNDGSRKVYWLDEIVEAQKEITDSNEFLEFLKIDLKPQDLIVSTPGGDDITLSHGATVLDFAYAVHSSLGNQCIGARINNQYVPLHRVLNYGEVIKILRNKNQNPSNEWLAIAKTAKAKGAIRKSIRDSKLKQYEQLGEAIFIRILKQIDFLGDNRPSDEFFINKFPVSNLKDLYYKLGSGDLTIDFFRQQLIEDFSKPSLSQDALFINAENINLAHFSDCCAPLPGDPLLGIFVPGKGIHIHHVDCVDVLEKQRLNPDEVIPVWWTPDDNTHFEVGVEVLGIDRDFLLRDLTDSFQTFGISVVRASIDTLGENIRNHFQIKIHGLAQLNALIRKLKEIKGVKNVLRL